MHIQFYGIYGIENIKTINKHRLELEELDEKIGPDHYSKDYKIMKKILMRFILIMKNLGYMHNMTVLIIVIMKNILPLKNMLIGL